MRSNQRKTKRTFTLEILEGRVALSAVGGLGHAIHHELHRHGHAAAVHMMQRGHNALAGHNASHDSGSARTVERGADDPAGHDANDANGGQQELRHGADDPANHDANDDNGGQQELRHGADDPAGHK